MEAYILKVSGHVQGVGFRWFTEREALKRHVRGYVRNLPDGGVEIWAQAELAVLQAFFETVRRGPSGSRVVEVESRPVPVDESLSSFRTRW